MKLKTKTIAAILFSWVLAGGQPLDADLLVSSPDTQNVHRYDDQGNFLGELFPSSTAGISIPSGIAMGPDGLLYVSDGPSNRILRFTSSGQWLDVFAEGGSMIGPTDLEFRGDKLYVGLWNQTTFRGGVARLDADSGQVEQVMGNVIGRTHAIEFDASGRLFVSHFDASSVRVYDAATGSVLDEISGSSLVGNPMGISFDPQGRLLVNDWTGNLRAVDVVNKVLDESLVTGLGNTQWHATAPDGSLIVDDFNNQRLLRYDPVTGAFLGEFATLAGQPEKFIFVASVPEPTAMSLLGLLAVSVGLLRRRSIGAQCC